MKDYIALWLEGLPKLHPSSLEFPVSATGVCERHFGGHLAFAKITLRIEPAASFEVVDDLPEDEEFRKGDYLDWAVFGLLDVLMLAETGPIGAIRVVVTAAEHSRVESSRMAFRWAGRDAGKRIIESIKEIRQSRIRENPRLREPIIKLTK
jgi:hypothetical protein